MQGIFDHTAAFWDAYWRPQMSWGVDPKATKNVQKLNIAFMIQLAPDTSQLWEEAQQMFNNLDPRQKQKDKKVNLSHSDFTMREIHEYSILV